VPTLAQYRQRMLELDPTLGRVETLASATTTSLVVTRLSVGGMVGKGKFEGQWLLRPSAGSQPADRIRLAIDYNSNTGALIHDGTAYSDTTTTGEVVEIHEHEPFLLESAIQDALRSTRRLYRVTMPTHSDGMYWLDPYTWITSPADIRRIGTQNGSILTPNRYFEDWTGFDLTNNNGTQVPDLWTLGFEASSTFAPSTTAQRGQRSLSVTRSGTDVTFSYTIGILETGVSSDNLQGETVTGVIVAQSGTASSVRFRITDGVDTTNSDYHTGGGGWEKIEAEHTINAAATTLTFSGRVEQDEAALFDEAYLLRGSISDGVRRGGLNINWFGGPVEFISGAPIAISGPKVRGQTFVVESEREYSQFDPTRIRGGTADDDTNDAPLDLIAYKALARFYEDRTVGEEASPLDIVQAAKYANAAGTLQQAHLYVPDDAGRGMPMLSGVPYGRRAVAP